MEEIPEEVLFDGRRFNRKDWIAAVVLGVAAFVFFAATLLGYSYPGEPAMLEAAWNGFDVMPHSVYPAMEWAYRVLGLGKFVTPAAGALSTMFIFLIVTRHLRMRIVDDSEIANIVSVSRLGGIIAALLFALSPSVSDSATRLDPKLFDLMIVLAAFAAIPLLEYAPKGTGSLFTMAVGAAVGYVSADSVLYMALLPLYVMAVFVSSSIRGDRGYPKALLLVLSSVIAFLWFVRGAYGGILPYALVQREIIRFFLTTDGVYLLVLFGVIPFMIFPFSAERAFVLTRGLGSDLFHLMMTVMTVIAVATPFAAYYVLDFTPHSPVLTSAAVSVVAGYLATYWRIGSLHPNAGFTLFTISRHEFSLRFVTSAIFIVFLAILAGGTAAGLWFRFNERDGSFADKCAERVLADLGGRDWFITDGTLDSHLLLAAKRAGKNLHLIALQRDTEEGYRDRLADVLEAEGLGAYAKTLRENGVLAFISEWFGADENIAGRVAVWGAPDIWLYANDTAPTSEFMFFGGNNKLLFSDLAARKAFVDGVLPAEEGWGSFSFRDIKNHLDRRRLNLRRHFGFVTCNAGSEAFAAKRYDDAFDAYESVLRDIDADNVSALLNEMEVVRKNGPKALAAKASVQERLDAMVKNPLRRYRSGFLPIYYGYLMNSRVSLNLGVVQMQFGDYRQGAAQLKRAKDLVPDGEEEWFELNVFAPVYATGGSEDRRKAAEIYESELERDPMSRVALVGLARLAMLNGDEKKSAELLERATAKAGDDPGSYLDVASVRILRDELDEAKTAISKTMELAPDNMRAWTLLASVTFKELSEHPNKELEEKLEKVIVPRMMEINPHDPATLTASALMKSRRGDEKSLLSARADLRRASRTMTGFGPVDDLILEIDIRLGDRDDAEKSARRLLSGDPSSPMANYVMGSVMLSKGEPRLAAGYLKAAAFARKPPQRAMNDLAEAMRRCREFDKAEVYARMAVKNTPDSYVPWETLGAILLEGGKSDALAEAERCVEKSLEMSRREDGSPKDIRIVITLAQIQARLGKSAEARKSLRLIAPRKAELDPASLRRLESVRESVR